MKNYSSYKTFREQERIQYGETRFCSRCKKDVKAENFHQRRGNLNGEVHNELKQKETYI